MQGGCKQDDIFDSHFLSDIDKYKIRKSMTEAQRKSLSKYDGTLNAIRTNRYFKITMDEFKDMVGIAEYPIKRSEVSCNSCRLRIMKEIAKDYVDNAPKKKVGRKPKIDLDVV